MQKATIAAVIAVIAAVMTGCTSTESVITEFDAAGKITRRTETSESVIKTISKGTAGKSVIIGEAGWAGTQYCRTSKLARNRQDHSGNKK